MSTGCRSSLEFWGLASRLKQSHSEATSFLCVPYHASNWPPRCNKMFVWGFGGSAESFMNTSTKSKETIWSCCCKFWLYTIILPVWPAWDNIFLYVAKNHFDLPVTTGAQDTGSVPGQVTKTKCILKGALLELACLCWSTSLDGWNCCVRKGKWHKNNEVDMQIS